MSHRAANPAALDPHRAHRRAAGSHEHPIDSPQRVTSDDHGSPLAKAPHLSVTSTAQTHDDDAHECNDACRIAVSTFGRFRVERGGVLIDDREWGAHRAKLVFKVLITNGRRGVDRDRLTEALWPQLEPSKAAASLNVAIHDLRRALEPNPGANANDRSHFVVTTPNGYRLADTPELTIDLDQISDHLYGDPAALDDDLCEELLNLYGGDFLPDDLYEEWTIETREACREWYVRTAEEYGRRLASRGTVADRTAAARWLERTLWIDPLRESAAAALIETLGSLGQRSAAHRVHARLRRNLNVQLGVAPLPETDEALRRALRQPGGSPLPPPPPIGGPAVRLEDDLHETREMNGHGGSSNGKHSPDASPASDRPRNGSSLR